MNVQLQHVGIQVSDIGRASDFYVNALDGELVVPPIRTRLGEAVMGGPPGSAFSLCIIRFGTGAIELFHFEQDAPDWARNAVPARVPHVALHVDHVAIALARVEAAGGRRIWAEPRRVGELDVIYVADLDANTIELISGTLGDLERSLRPNDSQSSGADHRQ